MSLRTSPQAQFNPAALCVLVADDHDYMRTIMIEVLRGAGVGRILSAGNAFEALDLIDRYEPDVLISDWGMDSMDGYELARAIRASARTGHDMPIIMMSGDTRRSQIDEARESGADEFVAKPVSGHKIITRLREVCRHPRPFVESPTFMGPCRRRMKAPFKGPMRRLSDPLDAFTPEIEFKAEQQKVVAACVTRVHQMALDLDPTDRMQVRSMYNGASEAHDVATDSADFHLIRATKSLMRYLQGMGATNRLQADVIATHLDAILAIIALPGQSAAERERLAVGLESIVTKKLRPADAA